MKTAISIPDSEFERIERLAARHGMNRSEFFRRAGKLLADELEGEAELTKLADAVMTRAGQPSGDGAFVRENERRFADGIDW